MQPAWPRTPRWTSGHHPDLLVLRALIDARPTPQMAVVAHLVGRDAELSEFDALLARLDKGQGGALEVVGEPGIGKPRLLAEFAKRADATGALVLSGSASELERDLPFSPFVDALDEYIQSLEPRRLELLGEDVRAELAHVLPSMPRDGQASAPVQHERYRAHRAVRVLLERLAATRPVLLVLDDLHWADASSVELMGALLHRPPSADVVIAIGLRPRQ